DAFVAAIQNINGNVNYRRIPAGFTGPFSQVPGHPASINFALEAIADFLHSAPSNFRPPTPNFLAVKTKETGSGTVEVHTLDAASNFTSFAGHDTTAISSADA